MNDFGFGVQLRVSSNIRKLLFDFLATRVRAVSLFCGKWHFQMDYQSFHQTLSWMISEFSQLLNLPSKEGIFAFSEDF